MNRSFLCSFKNTFQTWLVWGSGMIFSLSSSEAADTPASAPSDSPAALRSLMDESQKLLQAIDTTQPSSDKTSPEKPTPSVQPKSLVKLEKYCEKHPKNWEANYNLGVEKYQLMDYAGAKQSFSKAIQICQNPEQQENTFYNLGCACFRHALSNPEDQQIPLLEESLQNYENALALKKSEDTAHNIEVVKKYLKKRQKQKNKQQKKNPNRQKQQKNNPDQPKNDPNKDSQKPPPPQNQPPPPPSPPPPPKEKVDLKQQEMDNILNREKRNEKMLPPSSDQGGNDPVIKDW